MTKRAIAALILWAAMANTAWAAPYGPPAPARPVARSPAVACPPPPGADPAEIVVCARRGPSPYRLPLREERAEAGGVVRHAGEPAAASTGIGPRCSRPGSCEPSRLMETLGKLVGAATGNGP